MINERTEEILNRFKSSWTKTIKSYEHLMANYPGWEGYAPLLIFLKELQRNGEDHYFRLGTSISRLLISRSVEHGLRDDQKHIVIEALDEDNFGVTLREGRTLYREYVVKDLNDEKVLKLMKTLKQTLVD